MQGYQKSSESHHQIDQELITSNNISGTKVLGANTHGPKMIWAKASCANSWYLDSGCSRHMTGDKSRFLELKPKSGVVVTFGDNSKGHIEGIGNIYMVHLDDIHISNACF
ncbi:hypothetical protein GQ457_05G021570 [Hibiscus cannabinus]